MTGFASAQGQVGELSWVWDLRGVNGKGLDIRLRVPDWIDGLEQAARARLNQALGRGNVTASLRLTGTSEEGRSSLDPVQAEAALDAVAAIEERAMERGLTLAPSTSAQVASLRGVMRPAPEERDTEALRAALLEALEPVLAAFIEARESEGRALGGILTDQIGRAETLVAEAQGLLAARGAEQKARLEQALARVMDGADGADPQRVAQELAMIAVKSDVTEELDRLTAHIAAARALLQGDGPVGRKFDFLMQEFNREANTLCSKSGFPPLTDRGLELKVVIDQMREQVQNVE